MEKLTVERKYFTLFKSLIDAVSEKPCIEINELIQKLLGRGYNKEIIQESIYYFISQNFVEIIETSKKFDNLKIQLCKKPELHLTEDKLISEYPRLIINLPTFNLFGLESELKCSKISFFNMKDEFKKLFENAKSSIYICSPFLQMNGFKTFIPTLISKAKKGVDIKIVSRQIDEKDPHSRYEEVREIYKTFKKENARVSIRNYHYQSKRGINSSTHAKLIVCDNQHAYIGSGELRRASFEKNFEVGIILDGEKARQLGLIFEKLFFVSMEIQFDGEEL